VVSVCMQGLGLERRARQPGAVLGAHRQGPDVGLGRLGLDDVAPDTARRRPRERGQGRLGLGRGSVGGEDGPRMAPLPDWLGCVHSLGVSSHSLGVSSHSLEVSSIRRRFVNVLEVSSTQALRRCGRCGCMQRRCWLLGRRHDTALLLVPETALLLVPEAKLSKSRVAAAAPVHLWGGGRRGERVHARRRENGASAPGSSR
jgi:hypothetical protein